MAENAASPFDERFQLLVQSGQANEESVAAASRALTLVERRWGIRLSEEWGAPLASHIAITMKRVMEGEVLCEVPAEVWEEIRAFPDELAFAQSIADELEKVLGFRVSQDEIGFIAVHLCKIKIDAGLTSSRQAGP